jgi:hypothetical protein
MTYTTQHSIPTARFGPFGRTHWTGSCGITVVYPVGNEP